jgi:hypothetical protein
MPGRTTEGDSMGRFLFSCRRLLTAVAMCTAIAMGARATTPDQANPTDKLKNLEFREIGPATMGGRIDDFAVVENNPNIVFVGVASGGVWKTTNNGTTWEPVFRGAMGHTNRWTAGRRGKRWDWRRRGTSGGL